MCWTSTRPGTGRRVTVRLVDLGGNDSAVARAERSLAPAELARARRGTAVVHRRRVLLRAALRDAVAEHIGTEPARVPIATTAAGRPFVAGATGLDMNCSASGTLGIVVLALGLRVGVDVELVPCWSDEVLDEGWLAPVEQAALTTLPVAHRATEATRAWTRKEAVLKARGSGLLDSPVAVVTPVGEATGTVAGWHLDDLPVPAGWVASLALGALEETSS